MGTFPPRFVAPLYVGSAMNPINSSVIATALVSIAAATGVSVGQTAILVSVLYLASAVGQPAFGKLAEEAGPKRIFLAGSMLVLVGGIVGGVGSTLAQLVIARVLIGLGTSAAYPSAMLMIRRRASDAGLRSAPGNVLGGLAIAAQVTVAIGPTIGGVLIAVFGWRSAFLINVPLVALAVAMAVLWLPNDPPAALARPRELASHVDAAGILGFAAAMTALLIFLRPLPTAHWAVLVVALLLFVLLCAWELRAATPFIDLRLLSDEVPLTRTYVRSGLALLATYSVLYGFTQWLEVARGYSAGQAGLLLLPLGAIAAVISRPISNRNLIRTPLIVASVALLGAAVVMALLTTGSSIAFVLLVTVLVGVASGTCNVANQTALYAQAPAETVGTAAGLLRTFGYAGSIASASIIGIAFHTHVNDAGLHGVALAMVVVSLGLIALTVFDHRLPRSS